MQQVRQRRGRRELFFITRGTCRAVREISVPGHGRQTLELCQLWPKDLCGELPLLQRSAQAAEASVLCETAAEVLVLPKLHFEIVTSSDRTMQLVRGKFEARYPPPEALVARFFQEGRWKEFQKDLIGEIRRTAADQPGRKGAKLAKEIFGKPAWTRPLRGEEHLDERPVWRSGTNRQAVG